ncbi:MAG: dTDP-4-dehydrorhamnose 3,5-epimerase [Parachlamydiaceae bacterium]
MDVITTKIPDVKVLEPKVFKDERGFFLESFNQQVIQDILQLEESFVQDNHSFSVKNVLRGLHYQIQNPQGKLVRVVHGEIFDVAVDLRAESPTFGKWVGIYLSAENKKMLWIPEGFAHGFFVVSQTADVMYKVTNYYDPASDRSIRWDDPDLAIEWPNKRKPLLSPKDLAGKYFKDAEMFHSVGASS